MNGYPQTIIKISSRIGVIKFYKVFVARTHMTGICALTNYNRI